MRKNVWRIDGSGANATEGRVVWAPKTTSGSGARYPNFAAHAISTLYYD